MTCASCVGRVDKALGAVPGVLDVNVNLASETATVTYVEGAVDLADLLKAAKDAGYPAESAQDTAPEDHSARKEGEARKLARRQRWLRRLPCRCSCWKWARILSQACMI